MTFVVREAGPPDRRLIVDLYVSTGRPARPQLDVSEYLVGTVGGRLVAFAGMHRFEGGGYLYMASQWTGLIAAAGSVGR